MPDRAAPWDAVTDDYETWVISPFACDVAFSLRSDVRRLLARWARTPRRRRVVLDLGCGRGDGLALVAGRVDVAVGVDVSRSMLDLAERWLRARGMVPVRCGGGAAGLRAAVAAGEPTPRTLLVRGDMHALAGLRGSADLVVAVNSISPERPGRAAQMFEQVAACLKPGGVLMAVLASLDAFQYLTTMAARLGVALPDAGRVDARGMFHEGGEQQQFFTPGDIRALCAATALRVVRLQKVRYPWRLMQRFGWGYFPGRPRLWDWHLVAQAPGTRVGRRT